MPLPGGPSDKLGNRYELRWTVRRMIDLITGRIAWLRIEPPTEDAIEFRCGGPGGTQAYQIKRGVSTGGHWSIAAMGDVLDGFGELLAAEPDLEVVFASEHAASELMELSERARSSQDVSEFIAKFLQAAKPAKWFTDLKARWAVDDDDCWERLRRVHVVTESHDRLRDNAEAVLALLFDAPPVTSFAALADIAMESVHRELRAPALLDRLAAGGIRPTPKAAPVALSPSVAPPPGSGVPRSEELRRLERLIAGGARTVFVGGVTGIGKTIVVAQFAEQWRRPVCWIDCELVCTPAEALGLIAEFLANSGDSALLQALSRGGVSEIALARLAAKAIATRNALLVWDGLDGQVADSLLPIVEGIAASLAAGAQIVTRQQNAESSVPRTAALHVGPLEFSAARTMLAAAFQDARVPDLEAAYEITRGHPYLLQLLASAASSIDLHTALETLPAQARPEVLTARLLASMPEHCHRVLTALAWLGIPFAADDVVRLGVSVEALKDLARAHLVVRAAGDLYRVHDMVAEFVKRAVPQTDRKRLHEESAMFLRAARRPTWVTVRAMMTHAQAASLGQLVAEAASALLRYALDHALYVLARDAAHVLVADGASSASWFPHFVLGKCARMDQDLAGALEHFTDAQARADTEHALNLARYERASVLCGLGRRDEADIIYRELMDSDDGATRAEARIAIALGIARRGDLDSAMALLCDAADIAAAAGAKREEAEAWQGMAEVLGGHRRYADARQHLQRAHALRHALPKGEGGSDVFGWFHLFRLAFEIDRAVGNAAGARAAARSLWDFAVLSGSSAWMAMAAHAMCLATAEPSDAAVVQALSSLESVAADASAGVQYRLEALEGLVMCRWTLGDYDRAVEHIMEIAAIGMEHSIATPLFGHVPHNAAIGERIVRLPGGIHGLVLPPELDPRTFIETAAARVLERRPELAQYAQLAEFVPAGADPEDDSDDQ